MQKIEKIGIALAFYNPDREMFKTQIKSILEQTYLDWVCVITVDEDKDKVLEHADVKSILSDSRFKININNSRKGYPGNFQYATELLLKLDPKVDAIAFSDQDDEWIPKKIQILADLLKVQSKPSLVHSDAKVRYLGTGKEVDSLWGLEKRNVSHTNLEDVIVRNICSGATCLIQRELIDPYVDIPKSVDYHDHWYTVMGLNQGQIVNCYESLNYYNQHVSNVLGSSKHRGIISKEDISASFFSKAKMRYISIRNMTEEFQKRSTLSIYLKLLLVWKWDFGFLAIIKSLKYLFNDKALSRAYLSFALGKLISIIN